MKQYLSKEQTAKLIELGFEKPRGLADAEPSSGKWVREAYSIGELIEMLPQEFKNASGNYLSLSIYTGGLGTWEINYIGFESLIRTCEYELIDAAFEMCVKLKEEGVI